MAITRAQQYRQMLENGGRGISLQEAKDMAPKGEFLAYINKKEAKMLKDAGGSGIMTNAGIPSFIEYDGGDSGTFSQAASTGSVQGDVDRGGGDDDRGRDPTKQFEGNKPISKEAEKALKAQRKKARYQITPSTRPSNRIISTLLSQVVPFGGMLYNRAIDQRAMGFGPTKITKKPTDIIFNDDDDDNQNMITQTPYQEDTTEDDVLSPIEQALLERGKARAFAKEGGRIGLQEGGGIEQRLEQLGGDVSSAEQLLQGINKRLQTAESSLGSGGGGLGGGLGSIALPGVGPNVGNEIAVPSISGTPTFTPLSGVGSMAGNQTPFDQLSPAEKVKQVQSRMMQQDIKPPEVQAFFGEVIRTQGKTDKLYPTSNSLLKPALEFAKLSGDNNGFNFRQEGDMGRYIADNDPGQQFAGFSNYQDYLNAGNNPVSRPQGQQLLSVQGGLGGGMQSQGTSGVPALGFADGGRIGAAEGGIMDLETGRQMYFLGKLVKKATRAIVKKIVKVTNR
jgi:hypothetical protein